MIHSITTTSLQDTLSLGLRLGKLLFPGAVICLDGQLGAGKTSLTKGIAKGIGIISTVNSPTFTIVKVYQGTLPLYHIDAYRLANRHDDIGLEDLVFGDGVTVIEWPEYASDWIPQDFLKIHIQYLDEHTRIFEFSPQGESYAHLVKELIHA